MASVADGIQALQAQLSGLRSLIEEREARTVDRLSALSRMIEQATNASERALAKAETANDKRFDAVNEFRAALADQAALLMPRAEYALQHRTITDVVDTLNIRVAAIESRGAGRKEGLNSLGIVIAGIIAAITSIAAVLISLLAAHVI